MSGPSRPVLRWHGGKFRIREWVISHFPSHEVYVEPFGGVASVLLAKEPSRIEVYNDIDSGVVNLFEILRDPQRANELRQNLELTPFSREEFLRCMEVSEDPVEEARRMIVLSFQSIGAKHRSKRNGWRTRTAKSIWSPCSAWNGYPPALQAVTDRMRHVIIENLPWEKLMDVYDDRQTLFYVDPPYPLGTRSPSWGEVYHTELTDDDHARLLERVMDLKGAAIVSSYPNPLYDRVLRGWERVTIKARAQTNADRVEALYISPKCQRSLFTGEVAS